MKAQVNFDELGSGGNTSVEVVAFTFNYGTKYTFTKDYSAVCIDVISGGSNISSLPKIDNVQGTERYDNTTGAGQVYIGQGVWYDVKKDQQASCPSGGYYPAIITMIE